MAHFRGWIAGKSKTRGSRLGSKNSGLLANLASWQGAVEVDLTEREGVDYVRIRLTQHVNGAGCAPSRIVYDGPISGDFPITLIGDPEHAAQQAKTVQRLTRKGA